MPTINLICVNPIADAHCPPVFCAGEEQVCAGHRACAGQMSDVERGGGGGAEGRRGAGGGGGRRGTND